MAKRSVSASVDVSADALTAFRLFVEEIDQWWVRGRSNFYDSARAVGMRIEPGVGGRYLEEYDDGTALEIGRITVWDPGQRLVYQSSLDDTEVEVRFVPTATGTRVALVQRLILGGQSAQFYTGWPNILGWFADFVVRAKHRGG